MVYEDDYEAMMKLLRFGLFASLVLICILVLLIPLRQGQAAPIFSEIIWEAPRNISNTPDNTSTNPFLVSDRTGKAHMFWAEKVSQTPGDLPDTLMYTFWDGLNWFDPIDLFFSPESSGTPVVIYPQAVIDVTGTIHLFWLAQPNFPNYTLFYSFAKVSRAANSSEWSPEIILADDLTGTKYSFSVQLREPDEIHIVYARIQQGANPPEERAITYLRSPDLGKSWSDPVDIFKFMDIDNGGSDTRLVLDTDNRIYATWTEWDDTGNGLRVWFSRSLNNGMSWEIPVLLSERIQNEYERDWPNIVVLDDSNIAVMWEGGWRAYRNTQYSADAGATWSRPVDTFPWLIGENGSVEFVRDSNGTVYAFVAQRIREGYEGYSGSEGDGLGLWYSVWLGGQSWSEPVICGVYTPMVNPKVTITSGNQVVGVWHSGEDDEVRAITGRIIGAQQIPTALWPDNGVGSGVSAQAIATAVTTPTLPIEPPTSTPLRIETRAEASGSSTTTTVILGMVGVLTAILILVVVILKFHTTRIL
jgi:hypothetical protein